MEEFGLLFLCFVPSWFFWESSGRNLRLFSDTNLMCTQHEFWKKKKYISLQTDFCPNFLYYRASNKDWINSLDFEDSVKSNYSQFKFALTSIIMVRLGYLVLCKTENKNSTDLNQIQVKKRNSTGLNGMIFTCVILPPRD